MSNRVKIGQKSIPKCFEYGSDYLARKLRNLRVTYVTYVTYKQALCKNATLVFSHSLSAEYGL